MKRFILRKIYKRYPNFVYRWHQSYYWTFVGEEFTQGLMDGIKQTGGNENE